VLDDEAFDRELLLEKKKLAQNDAALDRELLLEKKKLDREEAEAVQEDAVATQTASIRSDNKPLFEQGVNEHGWGKWSAIAKVVSTARNHKQVESHARNIKKYKKHHWYPHAQYHEVQESSIIFSSCGVLLD
jgi:hypothetical protein